jgi:hypothetical protein
MPIFCSSLQRGLLGLLLIATTVLSPCMAIKLKLRDEECVSYHIDAYAAFYGKKSSDHLLSRRK